MAYFEFNSREYALNENLVVTLSNISKTTSAQGGIFVYDSNDNYCYGASAQIENGTFSHDVHSVEFYHVEPGKTYYVYINLNLPDEGDWWWPGTHPDYPNRSYRYGGPNKQAIDGVNSFTIASTPRNYIYYNAETKSFINVWSSTTGGIYTNAAGNTYTFLGGYYSDSRIDAENKATNEYSYDIDRSTRYIYFNDYNENIMYFVLAYKTTPRRYYRMYDVDNKSYILTGTYTSNSYITYYRNGYTFLGWDYNTDSYPEISPDYNPSWQEPGGYMDKEKHYLYFLEDDTIKYYNLYYFKNPTFYYKAFNVSGTRSMINGYSGSTTDSEFKIPTIPNYSYQGYYTYNKTEGWPPSSYYPQINWQPPAENFDTVIYLNQYETNMIYYLLIYMRNWAKTSASSVSVSNYINKILTNSLSIDTNYAYTMSIIVPKQIGKIFIFTEDCTFKDPTDTTQQYGCNSQYWSIQSPNNVTIHKIYGIKYDNNVNYYNNDRLVIDTDGTTTTYYIAISSDTNIPTATLKYSIGFSTPFTMTYYLDNGENLPEPTEIYYNIACNISSTIPTWKNHYFTQWIDNETGHSYKPNDTIIIEDAKDHSCLGHFGFTIKYNMNTGNGSIDSEVMNDIDNFIIKDRTLTKSPQTKFKSFTVIKKTDEDLIFNEYKGGTKKAILTYDFYKWNSQPNGSGNYYDTNYNYIITELDNEVSNGILDLYAIWNEYESDYTVDKKITIEIKQNEQIKEGYKFLGYTKIKGSDIPQYLPGKKYQFLTQTILYPIFEKEKKSEFIKVNGQWEQIDKKLIKVNDKWYDIEKIKLKTEGGWKEWLKP